MSAGPSTTSGSSRLRELDVVRVVTFACVIAVHVISHTAKGDLVMGGALILVHFTREVFFALSAWVLVHSYRVRPVPLRRFWPRRFLLVGVPYVVWSAIYELIGWSAAPTDAVTLLGRFGWALLTGTAYYHLYFLLVTMRLYLLFPLLLRLVQATRRHHVLLVAASFLLQLGISAGDAYAPGSLHWLNVVGNVVNYQGFIVGGAVAAYHEAAIFSWVRRHRRGILVAVLVAAGVTLDVYWMQSAFGFSMAQASTAFQPIVIAWSVVIGIGLLALGAWWVDRRPGSEHRTLDYLSDRSFGVFLAHPFVLWVLLALLGGATAGWPVSLVAVLAYVLVAAGALGIADIALRSPLSVPLAGRPRRRASRGNHPDSRK